MPGKPSRTPSNTIKVAHPPSFKVGDKLLLEVEVTRVGPLGSAEGVTIKLPGTSLKHTYGAEHLPNHVRQ